MAALVASSATPVLAQAGNIERAVNAPPAKHSQGTGSRKPAKAATRKGVSAQTAARDANVDAWTIRDALPDHSKVARPAPTPTASGSDFGRLQLDTGSVGLQTQTLVREGYFEDGRRVPGLETEKRNTPSYFGLSLSLPTQQNSLIPVPLLPRRE
jgi:hypothetical protein